MKQPKKALVKASDLHKLQKPGDYFPSIQQKGVNEASIKKIKNGAVFWTIKLDEESYYDCETQDVAETLSQLVKMNSTLNEIKKEVQNKNG